jgi:hypothetical protein
LERDCVEDQPQRVADSETGELSSVLRLVLRTQPRSKEKRGWNFFQPRS